MTEGMNPARRIPVILDTDIGGDIDDTWALAMMLNSPELDVKLITTCWGDTECRAAIVARMLEIGGRADIPIGIGIRQSDQGRKDVQQAPWVAGYDLHRYPGILHGDGTRALADTIMRAPEPVTLITIGPLTNIHAALKLEPEIANRCRFVGMQGSIYHGDEIVRDSVTAEWNVKLDKEACQAAFTAKWPITITPLDTCGLVRLTGEKYRAVLDCKDPLTRAVIENYRVWNPDECVTAVKSSLLYDTVAVHLAYSTEFLTMRQMHIRVNDDAVTVEDPQARAMSVAIEWNNLAGFEDALVARLTGKAKA